MCRGLKIVAVVLFVAAIGVFAHDFQSGLMGSTSSSTTISGAINLI
jgi:hypothetical protein